MTDNLHVDLSFNESEISHTQVKMRNLRFKRQDFQH